jgi:hypothetical protein
MTTERPPSNIERTDGTAHVELVLSLEPIRQRRLSIFWRWLLALPHFLVLEVISGVAVFGALGGWFVALFTGRLPTGLQKFLTGYLRYNANVIAYSTLLIDKWPSINFEHQADSLVDVEVNQVQLNRLAVLGRVILVIPGLVVSTLFDYGIYPLLFTMWVVGSITGLVPRTLHQAVATILRFQLRLNAYLFLVSPLQPFSGMVGDGVVGASSVSDNQETAATVGESSTHPRGSWRIEQGARRLVMVTLAIGVIGSALYFSFVPIRFTSSNNDRTLFQAVGNTYHASQTELNVIFKAFGACTTSSCIATAIEGAGDAHLYQATLALEKQAPYPSGIAGDVNKYFNYLIDLQKDINAMARATTTAQQKQIVTGKIELDLGNLTYRGIAILIYLGERPNFGTMNFALWGTNGGTTTTR